MKHFLLKYLFSILNHFFKSDFEMKSTKRKSISKLIELYESSENVVGNKKQEGLQDSVRLESSQVKDDASPELGAKDFEAKKETDDGTKDFEAKKETDESASRPVGQNENGGAKDFEATEKTSVGTKDFEAKKETDESGSRPVGRNENVGAKDFEPQKETDDSKSPLVGQNENDDVGVASPLGEPRKPRQQMNDCGIVRQLVVSTKAFLASFD